MSNTFNKTKGKYLPGSGIVFVDLPAKHVAQQVMTSPVPKESPLTLEELALLFHEHCHYFHIHSTAAGVLLSELELSKIITVRDMCRELNDSSRYLYIPLRRWAQQLERDGIHIPTVKDTVSNYSNIKSFAYVLSGQRQSTRAQGLKYWQVASDSLSKLGLPVTLNVPKVKPDEERQLCCPAGFGAANGHTTSEGIFTIHPSLGAFHLIEGWAHSLELTFLRAFFDYESFVPRMRDRHWGPYRIVYGIVSEAMSRWGEFEFTQTDYSMNVSAICHLAMMAPLFSATSENSTFSWGTLHPGWRMLLIVKAIENKQIEPLFFNISVNDYWQWLSNVCNLLDWPNPATQKAKVISRSEASNNIWTGLNDWNIFNHVLQKYFQEPLWTILFPIQGFTL